MKEKLPIWFQTVALCGLFCALIATLWWLAIADANMYRTYGRHIGREPYGVVYCVMSLPILALGARFCWRFLPSRTRRTSSDNACYCVGVILTFAVLIVLLLTVVGVIVPVQKVREATGMYATAALDIRKGSVTKPAQAYAPARETACAKRKRDKVF